jgi:DNA-binding LytR/AlgR family response regulator
MRALRRGGDGLELELDDGTRVPVSRRRARFLMARLQGDTQVAEPLATKGDR